jgi:hypothetical protein
MRRLALLIALFSFLLLAGCDFDELLDSQRFTAEFRHSYPMKPGGRLSLENLNGSVEIAGWNDNSIEIIGEKHAAREDLLAAIKIDIVNTPDSVHIRTVRPASEPQGKMGARYSIRLPRNTRIDRVVTSNGGIRVENIEGTARLKTSNGSVRIANLQGDLEATTSNGRIELDSLNGSAVLKTSNGSIRAENFRGDFDASTSNGGIVADLRKGAVNASTSNGSVQLTFNEAFRGNVRATTVNGRITVRLPSGTGARLRANTNRSAISSEFDVQSEGARTNDRLEGTIGSGGPLLELSTSNGSIRLLRL